MKSLPAILKGSGILTHYSTYPKGSIERAKSIGIELIGSSNSLDSTLAMWQSECDIVEREQPWKPLGLKSSADFIKAVTGRTEKAIRKEITKAQHARAQAVEVRQGGDQRSANINHNNIMIDPVKQGTGSEYLLRRLAKTAPDILDRYEAGEFKSVRAASIAAGHIKVATVLQRLLKLWEKATEAERRKFKQAI